MLRLGKELINQQIFKELSVVSVRLSNLKKRWFNFLKNLGWRIELVDNSIDKIKYDFKVFGNRGLVFRVFEINDISQLLNKELLINEFTEESFFDNFRT